MYIANHQPMCLENYVSRHALGGFRSILRGNIMLINEIRCQNASLLTKEPKQITAPSVNYIETEELQGLNYKIYTATLNRSTLKAIKTSTSSLSNPLVPLVPVDSNRALHLF